jgi:hypothetical protein
VGVEEGIDGATGDEEDDLQDTNKTKRNTIRTKYVLVLIIRFIIAPPVIVNNG